MLVSIILIIIGILIFIPISIIVQFYKYPCARTILLYLGILFITLGIISFWFGKLFVQETMI